MTPPRLTDFRGIAYLRGGNARQGAAYQTLGALRVIERLADYGPVLAGTVPLGIDVAGSDLDILCEVHDFARFEADLAAGFGHCAGFRVTAPRRRFGGVSMTASFDHGGFIIEPFGQSLPAERQSAYRHMVVEARLLALGGAAFRRRIVALKRSGVKTEPAFAQCLGLDGDAYLALLDLEALDDDDLAALMVDISRRSGPDERR